MIKMKNIFSIKKLLIISIVLVIGLLVVGCANKQAEQIVPTADNQAKEAKDATPINNAAKTVIEPKTPEAKAPEEPIQGETPVAETSPKEPAKLPVTQEELNSLKAGIEGIQADDLGGLQ